MAVWPPIPVPRAKLPLVSEGKVRAVINYVTLAKDTLMPPKFIIRAGDRAYEIQLVQMYEAYGLVEAVPHLAMVNCWSDRCDLSPLYAFAYPAGVWEVVNGYVNAEVEERWRPSDRLPGPNALRVLGDPKLARCLAKGRRADCGEPLDDAVPLVSHLIPRP